MKNLFFVSLAAGVFIGFIVGMTVFILQTIWG
jgi:hypothetical protein